MTHRQTLIEEFVTTTGLRNFEQLVDSLDETSRPFGLIVYPAGLGSSGAVPSQRMRSILADRRISKLYELLGEMDPESASVAALSIFEKTFEKYRARWEVVLDKRNGLLVECQAYATSPALFLCWAFCTEEKFLARVDQWQTWYQDNRIKGHQFYKHGGIPPQFLLNLYCNTLVRNGESIEAVNVVLAKSCKELGFGKSPYLNEAAFPRWDSRRGIGDSEEIDTIPVFTALPTRMFLERKEADLETLVDLFRVLIST